MSVPTYFGDQPTNEDPGARITPLPVDKEARLARIGTGTVPALALATTVLMVWIEASSVTVTGGVVAVSVLAFALELLALLFGYVTLCLWMQAARSRLVEARFNPPEVWQIWVPWLVPVWSLFGPFRVMRDLHLRVKGGSDVYLYTWWGGWVAHFLLFTFVDPEVVGTGAFVSLTVIAFALLLASYWALQRVIADVSRSVAAPAGLVRPPSQRGSSAAT